MLPTFDPTLLPSVLGKRMQLGLVVKDLDAALEFWTDKMKVGPFIVMETNLEKGRRFVHRGVDSDIVMSVAHTYLGETQLEIITQTNDAPSPYSEFFDEGRQGLNHIGFWPDNYEFSCRQLEQMGFEEICAVYQASGEKNVSYFSGPEHVGVLIEVAPWTVTRAKQFGAIEQLAKSWDGTRPVRRFDHREAFFTSDDFLAAQSS